MTTVDLIGCDAQSLAYDPSLKIGREEPIVPTDDASGRKVGPLL
jgi:hypothetical protein